VCEHLHLPLQSGSDRTLAHMHRGYTTRRYLERLAAARAAIPDLAVTTDLIVGFPGETDDDFERTLAVVDEAAYDAAYTFVFSPRPGTPAADMGHDFVAPEVAQERMARLLAVVERHALVKHEARVGRTETVLLEGPSKKDAGIWSGRTRQGKLVHFVPGTGPELGSVAIGGEADVLVTSAAPHFLRGDLLAVRPPRISARQPSRLRIPVVAAPA
jgi:tRNA-2-methylthio-N6-dimethylallyladenosine synthase